MSDKYAPHNPDGLYFLTLTVVEWVDVFTRREYKQAICDSLHYCQLHKGLELYGWCLMPSHLHLLARAAEGHTLGPIIRDFKKFTTKVILRLIQEGGESRRDWLLYRFEYAAKFLRRVEHYKMWQDGSHAVECHTAAFTRQKLDYLHQNPVQDLTVCEAEHYQFSSAGAYAGQPGLLEVLFIE
jgi:putative transposase